MDWPFLLTAASAPSQPPPTHQLPALHRPPFYTVARRHPAQALEQLFAAPPAIQIHLHLLFAKYSLAQSIAPSSPALLSSSAHLPHTQHHPPRHLPIVPSSKFSFDTNITQSVRKETIYQTFTSKSSPRIIRVTNHCFEANPSYNTRSTCPPLQSNLPPLRKSVH